VQHGGGRLIQILPARGTHAETFEFLIVVWDLGIFNYF